MKIEIVKFDSFGRGIGYLNNKIIFVPKTVPGDIIDVEVTLEKKKYYEGKLINIIEPSKIRKKAICPYFKICGGCDLMNVSLSETLDYKLDKVNNILKKNNIDYEIKEIIKNDEKYNYRNKISLKVINGKLGFYQNDTHYLVDIDYCYLCKESINSIIKDLHLLNIKNGEIIVRTNYNGEILLNIKTDDKIENIVKIINNHKIVGIVNNDKCIYGENYFIDKIKDYLFKVSYNSFFQINPFICSKLFDLIEENSKESKNVLDLYCGVGTLSIVASKNANKVLGVEIIENAIVDANLNKKFNNLKNLEFMCEDTKNIIDKITKDFDLVILDPPRSGVNKNVINKLLDIMPKKIIYVSCDPTTLARDLQLLLNKYCIDNIKLLDMFSFTQHVECVCVLKRK